MGIRWRAESFNDQRPKRADSAGSARSTEDRGAVASPTRGQRSRDRHQVERRDRDMGGLVAEAMRKVDSAVKLPVGYTMVWAAVQDQQRALARLTIMVRW